MVDLTMIDIYGEESIAQVRPFPGDSHPQQMVNIVPISQAQFLSVILMFMAFPLTVIAIMLTMNTILLSIFEKKPLVLSFVTSGIFNGILGFSYFYNPDEITRFMKIVPLALAILGMLFMILQIKRRKGFILLAGILEIFAVLFFINGANTLVNLIKFLAEEDFTLNAVGLFIPLLAGALLIVLFILQWRFGPKKVKEEVCAVEGEELKFDLSGALAEEEEEEEEEGFECPVCGKEFTEMVPECPECGAEFEGADEGEDEDEEEDEEEDEDEEEKGKDSEEEEETEEEPENEDIEGEER
jgi:hypothetical protein